MRILIADDQPAVRFALQVLLGRQRDIQVVGEAINAAELLRLAKSVCPDLVLLDWELPGLDGKTCLASLRKVSPKLLVIALSGRTEADQAARLAGVNAFVSKGMPPEYLMAAIHKLTMNSGLQAAN